MPRKKLPVTQVILAEPIPEQPIAQAPDWRLSPTPPIFDGDTGERITGGAAMDWQLDPPHLPWQVVPCRECRDPMCSRNVEKRDTCETCVWQLMDKIRDFEQARIRHATDRLINPFACPMTFSGS